MPCAPHVLVIDPHDDTRDMYAIGLASYGFRISTGRDGADALEYTRALQPDAVAMELSLPILNGLEVASLLKEDSSTNGVTLLAVTGSAELPRLRRALDAGFRSVLLKPCPPHELAAELHRALQPGGALPRWFLGYTQRQRVPLAVRFGRAAMACQQISVTDGSRFREAADLAGPAPAPGECPLCATTSGLYQFRWNSVLWHRCGVCGGAWRWAE